MAMRIANRYVFCRRFRTSNLGVLGLAGYSPHPNLMMATAAGMRPSQLVSLRESALIDRRIPHEA